MKIKNKKIFRKHFCFPAFYAVVFFCFGVLSVSAQTSAAIRILPQTQIENDTIRLGDIAKISGAGDEVVQRLKTISLGYAPNVGSIREIERAKIELAIRAAGFAAADVRLEMPSRILIKRGGQKVGAELLREAVETAILPNFSASGAKAQIVRLDLPESIEIPAGKVSIKASAPNFIGNLTAPFSVPLEIRVDERVVKRLNATVNIEVSAIVFVAAKNLVSGANLSEADVQPENRRLEKMPSNYFRDRKNLRGAVLLKNLAAGAEITRDAVVAGIVVKTGDLIRIVGESGKTKIIIAGEARASGRVGDRIPVKNLQSNAVLQAVVVDEGVVQVRF